MELRRSHPRVVGWSALSPLGVGRQAFVDGLLAGRSGTLPAATVDGPPPAGYPLAGFDPAALIGTKGTRTLDRMTLMVIATTTLVLTEYSDTLGDDLGSIGLVLGTSTGSIDSITGFLRDTFTQDRPYYVDPAAFPNTVMNGAAGRTAIWHGLRGPNSTVAGGQGTGLAALRYASRMIRRGYAHTLLVGCVEELSQPVAWAAHQIRGGTTTITPLGEGCVVFLVRSAEAISGTSAAEGSAAGDSATQTGCLAGLVDFEFGVAARHDPGALADTLASAIGTVLRRCGVEPAEVWLVSLGQSGAAELDAAELDGVDRALGRGHTPRRVVAARQVGNSYSALNAFQLAAALAIAESEDSTTRSRPAILTSVGNDGTVACALISL